MAASRSATGDLRNNLMKLLREVKRMKLQVEPNIQGLTLGTPSSLLPLLHSSLMHYSLPLAHWLAQHDYDLYSKSDLRFLEGMYKVLRDVFHYRPCLTREQFLSQGFAERKLLLVIDVLRFCQAKHRELVGRKTVRSRRGRPSSTAPRSLKPELQVLTVQETSGISSAWSEPLTADVQSADNTLEDAHDYLPCTPPPSPQHHPPAPAHLHTPTRAPVLTMPMEGLDVTPNPTPLKPGFGVVHHSSPIGPTVSSGTMAASFQLRTVQPPAVQPVSMRTIASGRCQSHASAHRILHGPRVQPTDDLGMAHLPGPPSPERGASPLRKETAEPPDSRETPERHLSSASINLPQSQVTALDSRGSAGYAGSAGSQEGVSASGETVDTAGLRPLRGNDGGSPHSWRSLPLKGEEGDSQSSSSLAQIMTPSLSEIGGQVEQLTRLMERMSARFVLLETRLKMAGDRGEGRRRRRNGASVADGKSQLIASEEGPEDSTKHTHSHHISMATPAPPFGTTAEPKRPEKASEFKHTPSPWTPGSKETTPISWTSRTTPTRPTTGANNSTAGGEPQTQLPQSSTHNLSFQSPLGTSHTPAAAACTPEDTRQLIEDLRNRATRTREFLQKANFRDLRTSA